ncbi:hypothetical protein [Aurantibacillus circumpalustris]|uniref:hypothetical protein n=1 Tax=Aurantibacillus circumpalustris TaxID=3036359 RepID=UPI00295BFBFD|nr:hypothetical protein [Aurantibacillus circumpalustris]
MLYITLLDQFHPGIYSSQVVDVCHHLNKISKFKIRIVAFLSVRELLKTDARKKLKAMSPSAIVFPAFPGLKNFELTAFFLFFICLFTGERSAICRNAFCTKMALRIRSFGLLKLVVLDGRSALAAEISEYDVFPIDYFRKNTLQIEKDAVNKSDFRMAVSNQLIDYWRKEYGYNDNKHVVIPCTLDTKHFSETGYRVSTSVLNLRKSLGFKESDIVFVYSGSTAPWQSFALLEKMVTPILDSDPRVKLLFLSKETEDIKKFKKKYVDRIAIKWVAHEEVLNYLQCGDYGILIREQSTTNKVASPVKFAEYLYAGLPVLISENLGDFSEYVAKNHCGHVLKLDTKDWTFLSTASSKMKQHCFELAIKDFTKESSVNNTAYKVLLENLNMNELINHNAE